MMNAFPKILMVTFGIGERLDTTLGWYGCIYYWVTILTYSYAVYLGVSCGVERRRAEHRNICFYKAGKSQSNRHGKTTASVINLLILSLFSGLIDYFLSFCLGRTGTKGAIVTTTIGVFLTEVVLFALALMSFQSG